MKLLAVTTAVTAAAVVRGIKTVLTGIVRIELVMRFIRCDVGGQYTRAGLAEVVADAQAKEKALNEGIVLTGISTASPAAVIATAVTTAVIPTPVVTATVIEE